MKYKKSLLCLKNNIHKKLASAQLVPKFGTLLAKLIDLNITRDEVSAILNEAGFKGYRFDGALEWICKAVEMVDSL